MSARNRISRTTVMTRKFVDGCKTQEAAHGLAEARIKQTLMAIVWLVGTAVVLIAMFALLYVVKF